MRVPYVPRPPHPPLDRRLKGIHASDPRTFRLILAQIPHHISPTHERHRACESSLSGPGRRKKRSRAKYLPESPTASRHDCRGSKEPMPDQTRVEEPMPDQTRQSQPPAPWKRRLLSMGRLIAFVARRSSRGGTGRGGARCGVRRRARQRIRQRRACLASRPWRRPLSVRRCRHRHVQRLDSLQALLLSGSGAVTSRKLAWRALAHRGLARRGGFVETQGTHRRMAWPVRAWPVQGPPTGAAGRIHVGLNCDAAHQKVWRWMSSGTTR